MPGIGSLWSDKTLSTHPQYGARYMFVTKKNCRCVSGYRGDLTLRREAVDCLLAFHQDGLAVFHSGTEKEFSMLWRALVH